MGPPAGRRTFSTAFRGFDQEEVKAYLEDLAREFRELRDRIAELESELEAERKRPGTEPYIPKADVVAITNALGEETARVLRTAQEAADDLRARAEEGATTALKDAHEEAARVRAEADTLLARRTAEAEAAAARTRSEAEEAAAAVRAEAKEEAERTIADAIEQGRDMLSQAQAARERVLSDLARRRKVGLAQLERLRSGREELSATLTTARVDMDRMIAALAEADEEARRVEEALGPLTPRSGGDEPAPEAAPPAEKAAGTAENAEGADRAAKDEAAGATPAVVTEEVGAPVAGAAAPATDHAGTPAATVAALAADGDVAVQGEGAGGGASGEGPGSPPPRAPYKHDRVPAAVLPDEAVGGVPEPRSNVDALFARIRADRATKEDGPAAEDEAHEAPARDDHSLEAPRSDADESFLQRRDALVEAPTASITRAVKRGLADEQNLALERLRTARSPTLDAVLDDEAAHLARASRWAAPGLAAAARAGASLAGKPDMALPEEAVSPSVARLADELVRPLRRRVAAMIADGRADLPDRVNGAYREARARTDRVIGDAVTEAVSNAFVAASPAGTMVRWVVDDPDGPCADCDDNALAGPTPLGQEFPTGQVAPPAHPGCRCVLAPAPA